MKKNQIFEIDLLETVKSATNILDSLNMEDYSVYNNNMAHWSQPNGK